MGLNLAVTFFTAVMVTVQVPDPVHAPDHPANVLPDRGEAVRTTTVRAG